MSVTTGKSINLSQLTDELDGVGLTACYTPDDGLTVITCPDGDVDDVALQAAVDDHEAQDPPVRKTVAQVEAEFVAYRANVQAATAQRDAADTARDDWLLDIELRLLDVEG